ncbi:MAG: PQQ-binding-like beta-propeller repeat protein [Ignavibacteria bacterium]
MPIFFSSCFPLSIDKLVEVDENEDWLYIGGDLAKTNTSKSKSNLTPPFKLLWQFDADGGLAKNSLSVSDAILFANTLNGEFYSIDINSGKSLGRTSTIGRSSYSTPVIFNNNVIITSSGDKKSKVFSYNLIKGAVQWERNVHWVESSPILVNEDIILSNTKGALYRLNARTGSIIWKSGLKKSMFSFYTSPSVYNEKIFLGSTDGNMYAFDLLSGKELWKYKTGASIISDVSVADGNIYFGSDDKNFYCLDTAGNLKWNKDLNTNFLSSSAFYNNNLITAGVDGSVFALNKNNGDIVWKFVTNGAVSASPLLQGSKIFIGSFDKNFYCLNADDGKELWQYKCEGRIRTSAVVWKDYIFVASDDKFIYCFK